MTLYSLLTSHEYTILNILCDFMDQINILLLIQIR